MREDDERGDYDAESNFLHQISSKASFIPERKDVFAGIKDRIEKVLSSSVRSNDRGKIPGWMRVLELIVRGYSYPEITKMEGMTNPDSIKKIKRMVIKYLEKSREFNNLNLKGLFESFSWNKLKLGKTALMFGAISASKKEREKIIKKSQKIFADFSQMTTKEICEKYGVHRSSAWRARKQGFLVIGKARHRWQYQGDEPEELPVIGDFFMPERNKQFWTAVRLGVSSTEWRQMWEWVHGFRPDVPQELLTKAKLAALNG